MNDRSTAYIHIIVLQNFLHLLSKQMGWQTDNGPDAYFACTIISSSSSWEQGVRTKICDGFPQYFQADEVLPSNRPLPLLPAFFSCSLPNNSAISYNIN